MPEGPRPGLVCKARAPEGGANPWTVPHMPVTPISWDRKTSIRENILYAGFYNDILINAWLRSQKECAPYRRKRLSLLHVPLVSLLFSYYNKTKRIIVPTYTVGKKDSAIWSFFSRSAPWADREAGCTLPAGSMVFLFCPVFQRMVYCAEKGH